LPVHTGASVASAEVGDTEKSSKISWAHRKVMLREAAANTAVKHEPLLDTHAIDALYFPRSKGSARFHKLIQRVVNRSDISVTTGTIETEGKAKGFQGRPEEIPDAMIQTAEPKDIRGVIARFIEGIMPTVPGLFRKPGLNVQESTIKASQEDHYFLPFPYSLSGQISICNERVIWMLRTCVDTI
jgi:hypothetical protein